MARVIVVPQWGFPYVELKDMTLKNLQETVNGYIEIYHGWEPFEIICNEEGLYKEQPNRLLPNGQVIFGDFVVAKRPTIDEEGNAIYEDLDFEDCLYILSVLLEPLPLHMMREEDEYGDY